MSAGDQEVLMLTAWEDATPAEIGRVLGISPNAASVRLHRARRRLRARLLESEGASAPAVRVQSSQEISTGSEVSE
jgi:RNA polymerase sigma-70 factor (ECF subfamily)